MAETKKRKGVNFNRLNGMDESDAKIFYDRVAESYHTNRLNKSKFFNEFLEMPATLGLLKNIRNKKVLDLGCGTGIYARILKRRGADVCGIDISESMIEIAKREVKNIDFKVGSAYKLPYKKDSFDVVLAALVIDHIADLDRSFKEINRVLVRNGLFVFSIHNPVTSATKPIHKGGGSDTSRVFLNYFHEGAHYRYWRRGTSEKPKIRVRMFHATYETLIRALISNGFTIEDYIDAYPVKQGLKVDKKTYDFTSRMPYFCTFKAKKIS
jgi:ubiquinone/menaquinone biosynthesis C-methylase UbiE